MTASIIAASLGLFFCGIYVGGLLVAEMRDRAECECLTCREHRTLRYVATDEGRA